VLGSTGMAPDESYPKLIALAAHELRSPVSVVSGYLRMLQRDAETPLSARQRKMVDEAERSCSRLVALISALSEVGKLDDGLVPMALKKTDLFPLVLEAAKQIPEGERGVLLQVRGQADGAVMTGDEDRLRAALEAIFHTVLRERAAPGTVVVERRLVGDGAQRSGVIVVADEASVQAALDATPASFDEKRGGVGFSLVIARRVIEAHGGRVWSPTPADGSGAPAPGAFDERAARSTVLIALPLAEFDPAAT
jgi:signal transduction histidine kinase